MFLQMLRDKVADLTDERARLIADLQAITAAPAARGGRDLSPEQDRRFDAIREQVEALDTELDATRSRLAHVEAVQARREAGAATGVIEAPDERRGLAAPMEARSLLDRLHRGGLLPDHAAERVERLMNADDHHSRTIAARWVSTAGAPAYLTGFSKLLADPQRGHMLWTEEERHAYAAVEALRSEMRSMSTTPGAGGYMIPLTLDPAIRLTSDGSTNPLRRIARVEQTVTNAWQGVTSAGATAEWKTEGAQVADGSPTIDDAPIPVHFGDVFVPYSFEVGMDAVGFVDQISRVMVDAADQLQVTAYTTGSGVGEPTGVITALDGTASEVAPTTGETFQAADVYKVQNALPPRFQARARWCAALGTINTLAQFETSNGALQFPELGDGRLLRRPLEELSNMKASPAVNPAATADNHVLLYGDFAEFVIVDRIGTTVELIPNLMGANGRPTGQRGLLLWFRTGSNVVVPEAFRVLNIATTA